jgi:dipeptidyl aminopeptidase/acylaminoacyl peptidase
MRTVVAMIMGGLLAAASPALAAPFTLPQLLSYAFVSDLVADRAGKRLAWVRIEGGVRNIWVADGPGLVPRQVTQFTADDGQELTQLTWAPDGNVLVFVRGGDHDSNWPATGNLQPDPTSATTEPKITLWRAGLAPGSKAARITEGDAPALSAHGELAFLRDGQVWLTRLKVIGETDDVHRGFFDRGKDGHLTWSPDGSKLAFVSNRGDHSFIGVFTGPDKPLAWLAPSTGFDGDPVWSPAGTQIAFTRQPGRGGPPESLLTRTPAPWAIWTADVASGAARRLWASGAALRASYPDVTGGANLHWAADDRLTFLSVASNWQNLYALPAAGGDPVPLTPGAFMVEHVALSPDGKALLYSANTGATKDDDGRRHIFRVPVAGGAPEAVTSGESLEWTPVGLADGVAWIGATALQPPQVGVTIAGAPRVLAGQTVPAGFPGKDFVVPKQVTFTAPDGLVIHGQLFEAPGGAKRPGVVFVHGGPPRQMLLGWSYMRYYSNAYAMNQYLAAHGFTVLSVNYRLGIGYGWDFQHPDKGGWAGSSEYQDVVAGARYLQGLASVDPARIGIWGGSYGGLLTGLALARNSDIFKAGVDLHGVHDWSRILAEEFGGPSANYEKGDRERAAEVAFKSSPVADVATWTSPVLFIHGDDDRNVRFNQTIDLVRRLQAKGTPFEELVIPDEIHDFLRAQDWATVDAATAEFLTRKLGVKAN